MRKFNINVNGKSYFVEVEESSETGASASIATAAPTAPVASAAVNKAVVSGGSSVTSPMPGLILKFLVSNGATVKKGDKVIVLEAMKMENDVFATADGVITFTVKQGDSVETGNQLASIK